MENDVELPQEINTGKSKMNVIKVSKSGVFSIDKFKQLYEQHDFTLEY